MITIDFARSLYPTNTDTAADTAADAAHDFDHVLRVVTMAEQLARAEGADIEIVRAAALLHDIGLDEGRAGHETSAANRAREILREHGYAEPFIAAVAHAIESHRFRSGPAPETLEAKVLFDADKLDSIGAIGVARAYAFGGHRGQKLWAEVPPDYVDAGADASQHTAVHEYHVKLKLIKDRLYTASGRALAEDRHTFMVRFYEQLDREVKGNA